MPTYNYPFSGGVDGVAGYGDRWNFLFGGTWIVTQSSENWTVAITSTSGDFTIGVGNLHDLIPTVVMTYRDRVYLGMGSQFNFSDNGDPTGWEEQNPGAGFVEYLSQFGSQDTVVAFGQTQGRLDVIGRRSVQVWQVDADPNNFSLIQTLDNIGTQFPLSVQQVGDLDVYLMDDTGVRSLRTRETTLNAYVDDVGSPIDSFLQPIIPTLNATQKLQVCGITDPLTKNYWVHVKGVIYVLSHHPSSKVIAWSTYEPRGNDNVLFTPEKFVVLNGQVYCRSAERGLYTYGGSTNSTYDQYAAVTFQLPWLTDKKDGVNKVLQAVGSVQEGNWTISVATDPASNSFVTVFARGSTTTPNVLNDSTFDVGRYAVDMVGTHFALKGVSNNLSTTLPAVFGSFLLYYNKADIQ